MGSILIQLIFTTHFIAFGHGYGEEQCRRALIPRPISAAERTQKLVERYTDILSYSLEKDRNDYANSLEDDEQDIAIHEDPLACRLCDGATRRLLRYLQREMPGQEWRRMKSVGDGWHLGGFDHYYVYSQKHWLIVDPTYRQFLLHLNPAEFARLPRIFVGTPAEYSRLLRLHLREEEVLLLLKPIVTKSAKKP